MTRRIRVSVNSDLSSLHGSERLPSNRARSQIPRTLDCEDGALAAAVACSTPPTGGTSVEKASAALNILDVPHILGDVIAHASPSTLRVLRETASWMKESVDLAQRHFRLSAAECDVGDADPLAAAVESLVQRKFREHQTAERTADEDPLYRAACARRECMRPVPLRCHSVVTGVLRHSAPPNVDVLDIDGLPNRLWNEYVVQQAPDTMRALRLHCARRLGFAVEDWTREAMQWYDIQPRLVRYTSGLLIIDSEHKQNRLKPDPCAVYFCDDYDIDIRLPQLLRTCKEHFDCCAPITTVFNVLVGADVAPDLSDETRLPDIHLSEGEIILLFELEAFYARGFREEPRVLWNNLFYALYDPRQTVPTTAAIRKAAKGSITAVGHEAWPVDLLPHPRRLSDDWEGDGWRGLGDVPEHLLDALENWEGEHSFTARLDWWVKYWTAATDRPSQPELRYPECEPKQVRLITTAEWSAEIGDTYFELMTIPEAHYRSTESLPPFNDLVAKFVENQAKKNEEFAQKMMDPLYRSRRTQSSEHGKSYSESLFVELESALQHEAS